MTIQKVTLPNGKQILWADDSVYQRWPDDQEWEPIDPRLIEIVGIPRSSEIEGILA